MPEPKHIAESLQTGIEKLREYAEKMAEAAPTEEEMNNVICKMQNEAIGKYRGEIDGLHPADRKVWDAWDDQKKADVLTLLDRVRENRYFGQSKPEIDLTFMVVLCSLYNNSHVRVKLGEAYLWLVSNPGREKTNYRKYITNFMKEIKYETRR